MVTHALAVAACAYIQSVVYQHDVVPRASLAGFEQLRQEMIDTQWEQKIQSDVRHSPSRPQDLQFAPCMVLWWETCP